MKFNWFDILVGVLLLVGLLRGKKRGMSEELLDLFQWLAIVVVASMFYKPLGQALAAYTHFDLFWSYIISYLFFAIVIKLIFSAVKRAVGEKLVQADTFGRFEYYLGMLAGALRYSCMLLVVLALLNAKYISDQDRAAFAKMQAENFGTISFPSIGSLQHTIFYESKSGPWIQKTFKEQLIEPTQMSGRKAPRGNKALEEIINSK